MDKTEALLFYLRQMAEWMELQASEYEDGKAVHFTGQSDDSRDAAIRLRHKASNILQVIEGFQRLSTR